MPHPRSIAARPSFVWVVIVAAALAASALPIAQRAEAARPMCLGRAATIVGTGGGETIRGTRRADVIVARGGKDKIVGLGGGDRVCGGGGGDTVKAGDGGDRVSGGLGNDVVNGSHGDDVLRGQAGNDTILGGPGNDKLDGGAGTDACTQGGGTGVVKDCETEPPPPPPPPPDTADLSVAVKGPKNSKSGQVTFTVVVTNIGPDATSYVLNLDQVSQKATCELPDWEGDHSEAALASGTSRSTSFEASCVKDGKGAKVQLKAKVTAAVDDPVSDNDAASRKTNLK